MCSRADRLTVAALSGPGRPRRSEHDRSPREPPGTAPRGCWQGVFDVGRSSISTINTSRRARSGCSWTGDGGQLAPRDSPPPSHGDVASPAIARTPRTSTHRLRAPAGRALVARFDERQGPSTADRVPSLATAPRPHGWSEPGSGAVTSIWYSTGAATADCSVSVSTHEAAGRTVSDADDVPTVCWDPLGQSMETASGAVGVQDAATVAGPASSGIGSSLATLVG